MTRRVMIVDRPSPWRDALAAALASEVLDVGVSSDGAELAALLTAPADAGPAVVVIGEDLENVGGIDALYTAAAAAPARAAPARPVFLVTDVRADIELLELLRRRGVAAFLYRDEPIETSVDRLRATAFRDRRRDARYPVSAPATLHVGALQLAGTIENLSQSGAQVAVARKKWRSEVAHGTTVALSTTLGSVQLECPAAVRQLAMRRRLFGETVVVGLELLPPDAATRGTLRAVVRRALLEAAVSQRLDPDELPASDDD